jgi:hypothetical protein
VILLSALVLGLLAGWGWARWHKRAYTTPNLTLLVLVPAAFLPQLVVAYLPGTRGLLPTWLASAAVPASLLVFLAFIWLNRRLPGMPVLMAGVVLNLLVMLLNGGWMPISPETASHLPGGTGVQLPGPGTRFGQKDILLLPPDTRLAFLADRFLLPDWVHYQVAFSLGDILVAIGVFWLLASGGSRPSS